MSTHSQLPVVLGCTSRDTIRSSSYYGGIHLPLENISKSNSCNKVKKNTDRIFWNIQHVFPTPPFLQSHNMIWRMQRPSRGKHFRSINLVLEVSRRICILVFTFPWAADVGRPGPPWAMLFPRPGTTVVWEWRSQAECKQPDKQLSLPSFLSVVDCAHDMAGSPKLLSLWLP